MKRTFFLGVAAAGLIAAGSSAALADGDTLRIGHYDLPAQYGMPYGTFGANLATYHSLTPRVQIALRAEGKKVYGDAPFFAAAYIGPGRGYRANRFGGDGLVQGASSLRLRVAEVHIPVPGTIGIMLGADTSRVFLGGEKSSVWHPAFGGGVFFEMIRGLDVFGINVWRGDEETLLSFKSGFDF